MTAERWLPVVGHEIRYEVSDLGRVRSLIGKTRKRHHPRVMSGGIDRHGYRYVNLVTGPRQYSSQRVSVLVLNAFIGPRPNELHMSAHRDADRQNNTLVNLRWATQSENEADKTPLGLKVEGEKHYAAKLTAADIPEIRERLKSESQQIVADAYGVSRQAIAQIVSGRSWKSIQHTVEFTEGEGL